MKSRGVLKKVTDNLGKVLFYLSEGSKVWEVQRYVDAAIQGQFDKHISLATTYP